MRKQDLQQIADTLGGLLVVGVLPDSAAAQAGLRYGDILLTVNGEPTADWDTYLEVIRKQPRSMQIRVFREGAELEFSLSFSEEARGPALELDPRGFVRSLVKSSALDEEFPVVDLIH